MHDENSMNEKDVILVNPRRSSSMVCTASFPPLALYQLFLALDAHTDCAKEVIDFETEEYCHQTYRNIFSEKKAKIFMVSAVTHSRFEAVDLVREIRRTNRDSIIAAGGPHFGNTPDDTLLNVKEIDVVARGEGELTAVDLLRVARGEMCLHDVPGVFFRRDGMIHHTSPREDVEDLALLSSLTDHVFDKYKTNVVEYPEENVPAATMMTSRGCPFRCVFCSMAGRKVRYRDPKRVVDEMVHIIDAYGIRGFNFLDGTLTANPKHIKELCENIIERDLNVKWWCESRVNISFDVLDLMKTAGCVSVQIGVESGSDRVLDRIRKNITRRQVKDFCRYCNSIGLYVKPLFMFSLPDEKLIDVLKTFELSKSFLCLPYVRPCQVNLTEIYPGTELERISREKGILPDSFSWYGSFVNKDAVNKLLRREDPWEHVPVFIDRLSPSTIAWLIRVERVFESVASGVRMLGTRRGQYEACTLVLWRLGQSIRRLLAKLTGSIKRR